MGWAREVSGENKKTQTARVSGSVGFYPDRVARGDRRFHPAGDSGGALPCAVC